MPARWSAKKKTILQSIGLGLFFFLIGTLILPIFNNNKQNMEQIKSNSLDYLEEIGEETQDGPLNEPYIYHYAPENSFGTSNWHDVNWSFFKTLFRNNFDVTLEYNLDNGQNVWIEGNQYLDTSFEWQDDNDYWKINFTFNKPQTQYAVDARFTVVMNLNVLNYVEPDPVNPYCYFLNYTVPNSMNPFTNESEVYNCYFNWSDMINIPDVIFNHGVQDNKFWFRFRKNDITSNSGSWTFDPTFGSTTETTVIALAFYSAGNEAGYLHGIDATAPSSGILESISVYLKNQANVDAGEYVDFQLALYEFDGNDDAGNLLDYTDTITWAYGNTLDTWYTADVANNYEVSSGTTYYIVCHPTDHNLDLGEYLRLGTMGDSSVPIKKLVYMPDSLENPLAGESSEAYRIMIYATYSDNYIPTITNPSPSDSSINESVGTVTCNVTVGDGDAENMNVSFLTSTDNVTFIHQQSNLSVGNGSYSFDYTTTEYQTTYYWKVTLDDGTDNVSSIYNFETTPYRTTFFNDTFLSENWVNNSNNMTFESGWANFTYLEGGSPYNPSGDFNDGSEDELFSSEDGFVHNTDDDEGWYYGGNTPSSSTGANSPHEGAKMLYIESSSGHYKYDNYLEFPISLTHFTNVTVDFYYYMYGAAIKYLAVQLVDSEGNTDDLWNLSGQQQTAGNQAWKNGICGLEDGSNYPYEGDYEIRFLGRTADVTYTGDICIDSITIAQTNLSCLDGFLLSEEIFLPNEDYSWDSFYADVNQTLSCSFAIVDPDDIDYNITNGLTGDGNDISSITNASVMIYGNFSDSSVSMSSWNITWAIAEEPGENYPPFTYNPVPANGSTGISVDLNTFQITIEDPDGDTFNYTIWTPCGNGGGNDHTNGTKGDEYDSCWDYSTTYKWWVNTTDGNNTNTSWFIFTTEYQWQDIDTSINGTFYHEASWSEIDTSINGVFYNETSWSEIDTSINGVFYNTTTWSEIDNLVNGSFYHSSEWSTINNEINGSFYHETAFNVLDASINGSFYNVTSWKNIDTSINGSFYHSSSWSDIDTSINGVFYNETSWSDIDTSINGSFWNYTEPVLNPSITLNLVSGGITDTVNRTSNAKFESHNVYVNLSIIAGSGSIDTAIFNYYSKDSETWFNDTALYPAGGNYYYYINEFNAGNFSFDIYVNNTEGGETTFQWNKSDYSKDAPAQTRKYISLGQDTESIDYTPYYLNDAPTYDATGTSWQNQRIFWHDQYSDNGGYDVHMASSYRPTGSELGSTLCAFHGLYFNQSVCIEPFTINNYYYHFWNGGTDVTPPYSDGVKWNNQTDSLTFDDGNDESQFTAENAREQSTASYNWHGQINNYHLFANVVNLSSPEDFTTNNIYDFVLIPNTNAVIWEDHFIGFMIFNLPANSSLQTWDNDSDGLTDWIELFVTYTDPWHSDTDADGVSDLTDSRPNWKEVTTACPAIPTDVDTVNNTNWINVTYTIPAGVENVIVRRGTTGYPMSITDGTLVSNSTDSYANDTGLDSETLYYYSLWSWDEDTNTWSIGFNYTTGTTTAVGISWQNIDTSINGSFYNTTTWSEIDSSINGVFYNETSWKNIDTSINGSFYHSSSWSDISTSTNGSFYNITTFKDIDVSINGSFYNTTSWTEIDTTINGSFYHSSTWSNIDTTINGSFYNITTFQDIDTSINGSFFNLTFWVELDTSINGVFYNETSWKNIDTSINGSFYHSSSWVEIDTSINGVFYHSSSWTNIDTSINGAFYNMTSYQIIDENINGSFYNTTTWKVLDTNINGIFYNLVNNPPVITVVSPLNNSVDIPITLITFNITIEDPDGDTFDYEWACSDGSSNSAASNTNGTKYLMLDESFPTTVYCTLYTWWINVTDSEGNWVNESYSFTTYCLSWKNIDTNINGSFYNITSYQILDENINGTFWNITSFTIINENINGSFYNISYWEIIDNNINGTFWNYTFKIITISNEFPINESMGNRLREILNITINHYNGSDMNITWYYGNSSENTTNILGDTTEINNGTYFMAHPYSEEYYEQYYWRLNITDEYGFYVEEIFNYRTGGRDWTPGLLPSRNFFWIVFGSLGLIGLFGILRRRKRNNGSYTG